MESPKGERPLLKHVRFEDIILFEDEAIVVINKPGGMASLDDKSQRNVQALARQYNPALQLCHRLDKMTSGVMLLAKTPEAYRHIALQFQHRQVNKRYHTIVKGVHQFEAHVIDLPLNISTNKKVFPDLQDGKKAVTIVNTAENFRSYTLLECQPVTGRMHQIRVHLAAIACPIVGDELYFGEHILLSDLKRKYKASGRRDEQPVNHGYLLHAHSIRFEHPLSGEEVYVEAPYPKNFDVTLKILQKYDAA